MQLWVIIVLYVMLEGRTATRDIARAPADTWAFSVCFKVSIRVSFNHFILLKCLCISYKEYLYLCSSVYYFSWVWLLFDLNRRGQTVDCNVFMWWNVQISHVCCFISFIRHIQATTVVFCTPFIYFWDYQCDNLFICLFCKTFTTSFSALIVVNWTVLLFCYMPVSFINWNGFLKLLFSLNKEYINAVSHLRLSRE